MIQRNAGSTGSDLVKSQEPEFSGVEERPTILIVDGRAAVRKGLSMLLSHRSGLGDCIEAENAVQALETINSRGVDLAIVDISPGAEVTEEIKLQFPTLPVLMLSMDEGLINIRRTDLAAGNEEYELRNENAGDKIVKAVEYVETLLRCEVFGFTVFVELKDL